ncbi:MAG: response regulator [Chitinivibrionales bacterium]
MKKKTAANILVIDDDEAIRDNLSYILEKEGHSVTLCKDGREGVWQFEQRAYDLVITDIMMPCKDGLDFLIELEKINPGAPVLAISGADINGALLKAATLYGAAYALKKPFTKIELLSAVADIFDTIASRA